MEGDCVIQESYGVETKRERKYESIDINAS